MTLLFGDNTLILAICVNRNLLICTDFFYSLQVRAVLVKHNITLSLEGPYKMNFQNIFIYFVLLGVRKQKKLW